MLRYYSFMALTEIDALEAEDASRQGRKLAQQVLADELTELVHGRGRWRRRGASVSCCFAAMRLALGERSGPTGPGWHAELPSAGAAGSAEPAGGVWPGGLKAYRPRAARGGAISLNGVSTQDEWLAPGDRLFGRYLLLRRGRSSTGWWSGWTEPSLIDATGVTWC